MKRATYAIPLAGLGAALTGCGDPIITEFNATLIDDIVFPDQYSYTDPQTGVTCSESNIAKMVVNESLQALISVAYTYICDDGSQNTNLTYAYVGTVEVVERKASYKITIGQDENQIALDCTMNENLALACADQDGAEWAFELAE